MTTTLLTVIGTLIVTFIGSRLNSNLERSKWHREQKRIAYERVTTEAVEIYLGQLGPGREPDEQMRARLYNLRGAYTASMLYSSRSVDKTLNELTRASIRLASKDEGKDARLSEYAALMRLSILAMQ